MLRFLFTVFKGAVIVGAIVLVFLILSVVNGRNSSVSVASSRPVDGSVQCLRVDTGAFYLGEGRTIETRVLPKGAKVVVLGSDDDFGEIDLTVPGKAFLYGGTTYAAASNLIGNCS